jgi:hypothetical protein
MAVIAMAQREIKFVAIHGNAGRTVSNYRPGGAVNVARAQSIDPDRRSVDAFPARPTASAFATPTSDIRRGDLPASAPATNMRGLY